MKWSWWIYNCGTFEASLQRFPSQDVETDPNLSKSTSRFSSSGKRYCTVQENGSSFNSS
jgi:hypothetical protein